MSSKRKITSIGIAISFCLLSGTGIVMYFQPFQKTTASIHTVFGLVFLLLAVGHIINNIRPLKNYFLNTKKTFLSFQASILASVLCLLFMGLFFNIQGFQSIYNWGNTFRNSLEGITTLDDGTQRIAINKSLNDLSFSFDVKKGPAFRYPMMVIWIEDLEGNYLESLFVPKAMATSEYHNAKPDAQGIWRPGIVRRPESLPYWAHKRGIPAADGLMIPMGNAPDLDAVSGATPTDDFIITTQTRLQKLQKFRILLEVNQSDDWNAYFHKNRFPNDSIYSGGGRVGQPALIYGVTVDLKSFSTSKNFLLEPIGHSHPSGKNGTMYTDLSTISTAFQIFDRALVKISK